MEKVVEIKCSTGTALDIENIHPFQGDLKKLSKVNEDRLKKKILELGFSEPMSVWEHEGKNYILNGHQRLSVLRAMRKSGYTVPEIPVAMVEAKDIKEAKKKVLSLTSQFGEITEEGLFNFMNDSEIDFKDLDGFRLPEINLEKFADEFGLTEPKDGNGSGVGESEDNSPPDIDEQFILTIDCRDEGTLERMYERMKEEGFEVKMVT